MRKLLAIALLSGVAGLAEAPSVKTLLDIDRQFCQDSADKGVDGWLSYFAGDAVVFPAGGPIARGRKAVEAHYRQVFSSGKVPVTWTPLGGEIAAGGDLGFTYGTWERVQAKPDGQTAKVTGKYQTTWKKQKDGSWKIVADIGNPDSQ